MTYELPEFLQTAASSLRSRQPGICEDSEEKELFMDAENDLDFAEDFIIPSSDQADLLFGGEKGMAEFSGKESQEFTERKALSDYGLLDSVALAESESSNVSVVTISDEALTESREDLPEDNPRRKLTPHVSGITSNLRCRPPPPPYPGVVSSTAPPPSIPPANAGRSRTPLCVPPSSFNAPVSKDLSTDVWSVDYV